MSNENMDPRKLPERDWEIYKLKEMAAWENTRAELQRDHERHLEEFRHNASVHASTYQEYSSEFSRLAQLGQQLYALVVTSTVLASGGGMTAIISIFGEDLADSSSGLPEPFGWMFKLFAASLIFTLAGAGIGRLANDQAMFSMGIDVSKFPAQQNVIPGPDRLRKILNKFAYFCAIIGIVALFTAIVLAAVAS